MFILGILLFIGVFTFGAILGLIAERNFNITRYFKK